MRTGIRIDGLDGPRLAKRGMPVWLAAGILGLAPLGASSAAETDASVAAAQRDPGTSAAIVELVPVQPAAEVAVPTPAIIEAPPPPAIQETVLGRGSASYYAAKFDGRRTASGERFDNSAMTAAHRTLPFGSVVRVTNIVNGRSVIVRINDRGPFSAGRIIDLSRAAAAELGLVMRGHGMVELALIAE
jgi:rare lipoprotein A